MTIREAIAEAKICLERSQVADVHPVVAQVMLSRAAQRIHWIEVMLDIGAEIPDSWAEAVARQRRNGKSDKPVIVAVCPTMTREEFIAWQKEKEPSHLAVI